MSQLCVIYGWTPDYVLERLTLEQAYLYLDYGLEYEEARASLLVAKIGQAMDGQMSQIHKAGRRKHNDRPDKKAFYQRYGDRIKRPDGGGKK